MIYDSLDDIKHWGPRTRRPRLRILVCLIIALAAPLIFAEPGGVKSSIKLSNGDRVSGELMDRGDDAVVLWHPTFGELFIPLDKIDKTSLARLDAIISKNEGLPSEEVTTAAEDAIQPLKNRTSDEHGFLDNLIFPGWKRHVGVGLSGSAGNSDTLDVSAAMAAKVEDKEKRWELSSSYFFGKTDGETYKSRLNSLLTRDWLFPGSPWFASAHGRYEFSKFEDWDHRVGLFVGPGYQFVKTDDVSLLSRLGVGVTRTFGARDDDWSPELRLGFDADWALNDYHRIEARTQIFPNIGDLGEFRAIASLVWVTKISEDGKFNLNLGIQNEYDSEPESESGADAKNNDLDYYARFGYDF